VETCQRQEVILILMAVTEVTVDMRYIRLWCREGCGDYVDVNIPCKGQRIVEKNGQGMSFAYNIAYVPVLCKHCGCLVMEYNKVQSASCRGD